MKQYEYFPHTADVKFKAYGKNLEEAFINSAYALKNIVTQSDIEKTTEHTIEVQGEDLKSLLYEFLEQFLILLDSEDFILSKVTEIKIEGFKLTAKIIGDSKLENYTIDTHIKAITYQEMEIIQEKDKVTIQVIPDL